MDIAKAIGFVQRMGSEEEIERLECILEGRKPKTYFIENLRKLQNNDGGFPLNMEEHNPSTLMDSGVVLGRLEEFNSLQIGIAEKIVDFFFATQNKDGSWNENENILQYNPPPWINPRNIHVKILSTAYTGFWLAKLGYLKDNRIKKACNFLINYRKENGAFEGFRHNTWVASTLFAIVYGKRCKVTRECLEFLSTIPRGQWVSSQIAWLLWCLSSANFTKNNKFVKYFLNLLSKTQNSDGSFVSEESGGSSVSATLEAVKALKYLKAKH